MYFDHLCFCVPLLEALQVFIGLHRLLEILDPRISHREALQYEVDRQANRPDYHTQQPLPDRETVVAVHMYSLSPEADEQDLQSEYGEDDENEEFVPEDAGEDIDLLMYLAAADEVEELHHHEAVEDEGEMPRAYARLFVDLLVVAASSHGYHSPTAHSPSHNAVVPFPLRVQREVRFVKGVLVLWDDQLSCEDEDDHDDELECGLAEDVLHHSIGDDVLLPAVGLAEEKFLGGSFSRKRRRGKSVHDKVDPQHLDGREDLLLEECAADERDNDSYDVYCDLELDELPNRVVDVSAPHHCLHD